MIYLFYGSDEQRVREKAFAWIAAARAKQPDLAYVRFTREELSPSAIDDATLSGGLFIRRLLVLIDDPFAKGEKGEVAELIEERVDQLVKSDNAIVIVAPKLSVPRAKKLVAKAAKAYEFTAKEKKEERGFNFGLVSALASRSREKLWLETVRALYAGDAPEMLHGLLHWKARDILEKGSRAWSPAEARQLSLGLIKLLQDSRRSGADLSLSLEKFALSV